jgi:hypothetical protein
VFEVLGGRIEVDVEGGAPVQLEMRDKACAEGRL